VGARGVEPAGGSSARESGQRRRSVREVSTTVREAAGGPGGASGGVCAGRIQAATVPGCGRRRRCGSDRRIRCRDRCGRRCWCGMRAATAMHGVGAGDDNGAGGVTSLLVELDWKPCTLRLRLWIENGEGRGGAHVYIVRDL
jgi:hypothetical protein